MKVQDIRENKHCLKHAQTSLKHPPLEFASTLKSGLSDRMELVSLVSLVESWKEEEKVEVQGY